MLKSLYKALAVNPVLVHRTTRNAGGAELEVAT